MLLPISVAAKGILWTVLFGLAKTCQYGGLTIWKAIETMHPEIEVRETCTPYLDRRNIHFYINRCGFHAVEFFNEHHPDPNMPEPSAFRT